VTNATWTHQDKLLDRLDGVRETGPGRWQACCPAHDDSGPSLSITQKGDGDLLLHCFAGCPTRSVLDAVGLRFPDLHPGGRWLSRKKGKVAKEPARATEKPLAPIGLREHVYTWFLTELRNNGGLLPEHQAELTRRGLSSWDITTHNYQSLGPHAHRAARVIHKEVGDGIFTVPGFKKPWLWLKSQGPTPEPVHTQGLVIPVRDPQWRIQALQVRTGEAGRKYVWFSSQQASASSPAHVPIHPTGDAYPVVRITEGPLKADVATALDRSLLTLGVASVMTWQAALPFLEQLGAKTVHVAFDSDWKAKPQVAAQRHQLAQALLGAGYKVVLEDWPEAWKGIDDLLRAGQRPVTTEWAPA
jgi:hypothetical protein